MSKQIIWPILLEEVRERYEKRQRIEPFVVNLEQVSYEIHAHITREVPNPKGYTLVVRRPKKKKEEIEFDCMEDMQKWFMENAM